MRVWIVKTGEPLPVDGENVRLARSGLLADAMCRRGWDVTWWTSSYQQIQRKQRCAQHTELKLNSHCRIRVVHAPAYAKNISAGRVWAEWWLARNFAGLAESAETPAVIHCSMPTLDLARAATRYGSRHRVPVALDIRDLWPDIFVERVPRVLRPLAPVALSRFYGSLRKSCASATAILGITPEFVKWGLQHSGRPAGSLDCDFPLAYPERAPAPEAIAGAREYWKRLGVTKDRFTVCFLGNFGQLHSGEFETVVRTARSLSPESPVQFVLCGDGMNLERYRALAAGLPNVLFPGWVGFAEAWTLMRLSGAGLIPYQSSPDFMMSIPNKAIEYFSAGLPVVSSIRGKLEGLLQQQGCGLTYANQSEESLAGALAELSGNRGGREQMGRAALSLYRTKFVADTVYGSMADHMERIARAGRRGGDE
jgi:glycosyltransferase involved in cell wall biosynthesis